MAWKKTILGAALGAMVLSLTTPVAMADRGDRGWHGRRGHDGYYRTYDRDHWRRGHWVHGWHDNDWGWWWVLAGSWYFYPRPVYPYPEPYYVPPVVVAPEAPPAPATTYWYYCPPKRAYYPYTKSCPSGWQEVPATPPGTPGP